MARVIECVPNLSEGRRVKVIDLIAAAVTSQPGVRLLHRTSDPDHNRSVLTFAGEPEAVAGAALAMVTVAYREIDMRTHAGVHPRFGAVDVLPFVPLEGVSMDECVALAHRVGREIASVHNVPVYFYARAALLASRALLSAVRAPQFEGLPEVIGSTLTPDAGPARVHPTAGAVAVGARPPLIAFNVELATEDLGLARRIAREIRASSGGLPAVQALGLPLASPPRVQVSCNLLDYRVTPLAVLYREIESRAASAGIAVQRSELIGLIPRDAIAETDPASLRLEGFTRDRIIENLL